MNHPDKLWTYIHLQALLATLTLDSLAQYDMLAPIHPRHESPDHWPEGWNPPQHYQPHKWDGMFAGWLHEPSVSNYERECRRLHLACALDINRRDWTLASQAITSVGTLYP